VIIFDGFSYDIFIETQNSYDKSHIEGINVLFDRFECFDDNIIEVIN